MARLSLRTLAWLLIAFALFAGPFSGGSRAWGATNNLSYDEVGRLTGVINDVGITAAYAYDATGNITAIARGNAAVAVLGFSPGSGAVGTSVTISGSGFSATTSQNTVQFNGVAAVILSASTTQLVVLVPSSATSGSISVTSPAGGATSPSTFTVTQSATPAISGFSPTIGTPGTSINVSGSNFQTTPSANNLTVNFRPAPLGAATTTTLAATVPTSATSGRLTITTPFGYAASTQDFFVPPGSHAVSDVALTGRMTIGSSQTVSLTTAGKIGLILFDGVAGQRVSLQITSSSFGSCGSGAIQILKPDGTMFGGAWLCNGGFIDTLTLPSTGTFTILVSPYSTATGSATFALYSPADVTGTIVAGGSAIPVTIATPGQNAYLTFSGTAGQRVSLAANSVSIPCYYLALLAQNGTNLHTSPLICGAGFVDPLTLPATGTYTVALLHSGANTGSATLSLYSVPPDVAGTITAGGAPVQVTTTTPGQDAILTFSGTAGRRISMTTSQSTSSYYFLAILNPDGTSLYPSTSKFGGTFVDTLSLPSTGTYSIVVKHSGSSIGSMAVTLFDVPPDVNAGTIVASGSAVQVATTTPGQDAFLTFSGTAGQRVSLSTTQSTSSYYFLAILKPDGTSLYPLTPKFGGTFVDTITLPATGTYNIALKHYGSGTFSLTANLFDVSSDVNAGTIVAGGSPVPVTINVPGQDAFLTFSGTAGQRISMATGPVTIGYYYVGILKQDGTSLYPSTFTFQGTFIDTLTLPSTGTYTIPIKHYGSNVGSVTVTLYAVPADATASLTVNGGTGMMTVSVPGQNAMASFAGLSGQSVTVQVTGNSLGYVPVSLLKPDGSTLTTNSSSNQSFNLSSQTLPVSGTYGVFVNPAGAATGSATIGVTSP